MKGKEGGSTSKGKEAEIKSVHLIMVFRFHIYSSLHITLRPFRFLHEIRT